MPLVIPAVLVESCATRQALERLAAKWRVLLVYALLAGPQRPAELRRRLPDISQKVLTDTLRGMADDGLVARRVLREAAPQHVEYALTDLGLTLREPLASICQWALEHDTEAGTGSRADRENRTDHPRNRTGRGNRAEAADGR
jgi:DNA-binding HxlR family transcriptional regulator